jgi:hypothetical protein
LSARPSKNRRLEVFSEPNNITTPQLPAAIALANSVTRCCGPCPPIGSRIARAGSAPIRCATVRE